MGFILGGLESEAYDRNYSDKELLRRIGSYFRDRLGAISLAGLCILIRSALDAGVPILVARGLDRIVAEPAVTAIGVLVAIVWVLRGSAWFLNYVHQMLAARAIGDVVLKLREDVFGAVVEHDLSFYDDQPTGKLVSRITSDTRDFAETVNLTMNLVSQVLSVVIIAVAAWRVSARLTLLMLAMTPVVFAIALSFRHIARKVTTNARRMRARVNANIQESVSGIAVAKAFRQEQRMYEEFNDLNEEAYRISLVRGFTMRSIFPILTSTYGLALGLVLYYGGRAAMQHLGLGAGARTTLTVGEFYLFMQAMGYFWFPMTSIASFWSQFQDGLSSAERIFSLIDAEPQVIQHDNRTVPGLQGDVRFEHVELAYTTDETVLPDFNLHVRAGETIALVGHTGAGKSSVARLLARLYEFQGGRIVVDGQDVREFDLQAYRSRLGFVPQVPFLFSGTVCDNICYGRPDATDDQIQQVIKRIGGGEWVDDLQDGLQTDVGERGARLSMGQRQLVALARVLLKDPAIFILDEATASVDPFTEEQIQEGLEAVMEQRTSIIIAHRLSTVREVDRILVMSEGRIIEEGNHTELLAQAGHYAELYNTYFRHQSLEYIETANKLAD